MRVKVCGVISAAEVDLAVRLGADALGFVAPSATGPAVLPTARIAALAASVPPSVTRVLLTAEGSADDLLALARLCHADALQIVDAESPGLLRELRARAPGLRLLPVVHVPLPGALERACRLAPEADALLLDSGDPRPGARLLGGTGRVHDWHRSRRVVEAVDRPFVLAGGLTPDNVAEAVRVVRPFAVDVWSGLRSRGRLDAGKLRAFVRAAGVAPAVPA